MVTPKKNIKKATPKTTKPVAKKPTAKVAKTINTKTIQSKPVVAKTTSSKKGLLNFLFSFNGNISKELFLGSTFILLLISLVLDLIFTGISSLMGYNPIVDWSYNIIAIILFIIAISLGYKRAHSLGISGFYSIVGTLLFKPYFCFFKSEKDEANDSAYKSNFEKIKKIGSFFGRTTITQLLYIALVGVLSLTPYMQPQLAQAQDAVKTIVAFIISIAGFNILQVIILDSKWLKKAYTPIVKVLSFFGYNFLIIGTTILIYSTYILLAMMQAMQTMPK